MDSASLAIVSEACPLQLLNVDGCRLLGDSFIDALTTNCRGTLTSLSVSGCRLEECSMSLVVERCRLGYFIWRDGREVSVHGYDSACVCEECSAERVAKQLRLRVHQPRAAAELRSAV